MNYRSLFYNTFFSLIQKQMNVARIIQNDSLILVNPKIKYSGQVGLSKIPKKNSIKATTLGKSWYNLEPFNMSDKSIYTMLLVENNDRIDRYLDYELFNDVENNDTLMAVGLDVILVLASTASNLDWDKNILLDEKKDEQGIHPCGNNYCYHNQSPDNESIYILSNIQKTQIHVSNSSKQVYDKVVLSINYNNEIYHTDKGRKQNVHRVYKVEELIRNENQSGILIHIVTNTIDNDDIRKTLVKHDFKIINDPGFNGDCSINEKWRRFIYLGEAIHSKECLGPVTYSVQRLSNFMRSSAREPLLRISNYHLSIKENWIYTTVVLKENVKTLINMVRQKTVEETLNLFRVRTNCFISGIINIRKCKNLKSYIIGKLTAPAMLIGQIMLDIDNRIGPKSVFNEVTFYNAPTKELSQFCFNS